MEKDGGLGVRRRPTKRRRRSKGFASVVVEYLVSDSYMYAPLIAPPPVAGSPTAANICKPPSSEKGVPVVQFQSLW